MQVFAERLNGKYAGIVKAGGRIVHLTTGHGSSDEALAAAESWVASQ